MTTFKKIKTPRIRLADEAYAQILEAIANGEIDPDRKIVQEKLAAELDISRTPVREALLRLEQEGILEIAGRGGFYIRKVSQEEVRFIYETRAAIEGYSARLLSEAANTRTFQQIDAIISFEEGRDLETAAELYDANRKIHRAFVERTQNRYLLDMFDQMWNRGFSLHMFSLIPSADLQLSLGEHHALCDVLRNGTPAESEAAMRAHIHTGLDLQLACMKDAPSAS